MIGYGIIMIICAVIELIAVMIVVIFIDKKTDKNEKSKREILDTIIVRTVENRIEIENLVENVKRIEDLIIQFNSKLSELEYEEDQAWN